MENVFNKRWSVIDFARFVTPSILSIVSISLYYVVDSIFISRFAGHLALAAVNIIMPFFGLMLGVGLMVAAGASALIGIELGEGKNTQAQQHFTLVFFTLVVLMLFVLAFWQIFGIEKVPGLLGASELLIPYCISYLNVLIIGLAMIGMQLFFEFFIRLDGKPLWALYLALLGGSVNLLLDYLLIAKLDMGIMGAGIATTAGIFTAVTVGFYYFLFKAEHLKFRKPKLDWKFLGRSMANGSSEMVTELSAGAKALAFNIVLLSYVGETGVAAVSILLYSYWLLSSFQIGLSMGVAPVISYCFGARDFAQIRRLASLTITTAGIAALSFFSLVWFAGHHLIDIYAKGQDEVVTLANTGLQIFKWGLLLNCISILASAFFTAVGNGKISAMISFLNSFVLSITFIMFLPEIFGVSGIWMAVPLAELGASAVAIGLMYKYRWRYLYVEDSRNASLGKTLLTAR
ncbi:MATE family efflux transporter [Desulfosediminicola sp.]|uniref:MATE family efflux transporter n=1 Tax=Desulfosediminicola sp. TaxID=2886825 RepID=UPI003AF20820